MVPVEITNAVWRGDVVALDRWARNGGDLNAKDQDGAGLLSLAARLGHVEAIKMMLSRGAHVSQARNGYEAIHYAVCMNQCAAVETLLDGGADCDARAEITGETPLHFAAAFGSNQKILKLLLRRGARMGLLDASGRDAEARAVSKKKTESTKLLADVRNAGSFQEYVLKPRLRLLALRSLCAQGRARPLSTTPDYAKRLFAGAGTAPPDPLFWHILGFWWSP